MDLAREQRDRRSGNDAGVLATIAGACRNPCFSRSRIHGLDTRVSCPTRMARRASPRWPVQSRRSLRAFRGKSPRGREFHPCRIIFHFAIGPNSNFDRNRRRPWNADERILNPDSTVSLKVAFRPATSTGDRLDRFHARTWLSGPSISTVSGVINTLATSKPGAGAQSGRDDADFDRVGSTVRRTRAGITRTTSTPNGALTSSAVSGRIFSSPHRHALHIDRERNILRRQCSQQRRGSAQANFHRSDVSPKTSVFVRECSGTPAIQTTPISEVGMRRDLCPQHVASPSENSFRCQL